MTDVLFNRILGRSSGASAELVVRYGDRRSAYAWPPSATASSPTDHVLRNVWCASKPAWLLVLESLICRGDLAIDEAIDIGDGFTIPLLDLLSGSMFGLAQPKALTIRTTSVQARPALLRASLNTTPPKDAHSEVAFSWISREILHSRTSDDEGSFVMRALDEAGLSEFHLYPILALQRRRFTLANVHPTEVEVNGRLRMSYHDRTAVVCGDPDYALMCGLSSADGLARLGQALIRSSLAGALEDHLKRSKRIHGAGILHFPSLGGYPQISDDWRVVIGWQATGILTYNPSLDLSVGFTCGESITTAADKQLLLHQITRFALEAAQ